VLRKGLEQRYTMGEKIGKGTFAEVYKASNNENGRVVAVKVVKKSKLDMETRELLRNELENLKLISRHPGIVTLHEFAENTDNINLVFEYVAGWPLLDKIVERGSFSDKDARLTVRALFRTLEVLATLGLAHHHVRGDTSVWPSPSSSPPSSSSTSVFFSASSSIYSSSASCSSVSTLSSATNTAASFGLRDERFSGHCKILQNKFS